MRKQSTETGEIQVGKKTIPFVIARSKRRKKTITITVDPVSGVVVHSPLKTPYDTLHRITRKRALWIIGKLSDIKDNYWINQEREFVSGESIFYLGRHYRLKVCQSTDKRSDCKMKGRWIEVRIPCGLSPEMRKARISELLTEWYKKLAEDKFLKRSEWWSNKTGISFNSIIVTSQQKRWGSCDAHNNLRLNWKIIMAPISLLDYVIVHELCHVIHKNHSEDFWRLLGSVMPDYEIRKRKLRNIGAGFSL